MFSAPDGLVFRTRRIAARTLQAADVESLLAVYGDAQTVRWIGDGVPLTRGQCEHWVAVTHRNYASRGYGMYALADPLDGHVIGFIGLVHPDSQDAPELKYALCRPHRGRGLATEAAEGMLAYAATSLGLGRVLATIAPENEASRRVLSRIGMRFVEATMDRDGLPTHVYAWDAGWPPACPGDTTAPMPLRSPA